VPDAFVGLPLVGLGADLLGEENTNENGEENENANMFFDVFARILACKAFILFWLRTNFS
jgi:hypothetical protein